MWVLCHSTHGREVEDQVGLLAPSGQRLPGGQAPRGAVASVETQSGHLFLPAAVDRAVGTERHKHPVTHKMMFILCSQLLESDHIVPCESLSQ